jgi:SulP family sulfate permease
MGRFVSLVPDSIVVGFTIGIACVIVTTQMGHVLDIKTEMIGHSFLEKLGIVWDHSSEINAYAITLALGTFALSKAFFKMSVYIPGPLIALGIGTLLTWTVWAEKGIVSIKDEYGSLPADLLVFTPPASFQLNFLFFSDLVYAIAAITFVGAVESLLSSRMADRLADNKGTPFNPNKELWGQGWVNVIAPLLNGFPHTGALARTATNIRVGAISPLAGISKCVFKLLLVAYLGTFLEHVPMACIGGIMLYVAVNMVKPAEISLVLSRGRLETLVMVYTAIMVLVTDFVTGVGTAIVLYSLASSIPPFMPAKGFGKE